MPETLSINAINVSKVNKKTAPHFKIRNNTHSPQIIRESAHWCSSSSTFLDSFSKYAQAYPIEINNNPSIISCVLKLVAHHGNPKQVTSDNGLVFSVQLVKNFSKKLALYESATL